MSPTTLRVLLIISGSIAAYKAAELLRTLVKSGASVRVVLTEGGAQFITASLLRGLGAEVVSEGFQDDQDDGGMRHIDLPKWADVIAVVPASAALIARLSRGDASDMASACLLSAVAPVLLAPAMNTRMLHHKATQDNLNRLRSYGYLVTHTNHGELSCGEVGDGRLVDVFAIADEIKRIHHFQKRLSHPAFQNHLVRLSLPPDKTSERETPPKGHILLTLGATESRLDPVRYLTNHSSGRMGFALAGAFSLLGFEVHCITGNCITENCITENCITGRTESPAPLPIPLFVNIHSARETTEMLEKARSLSKDAALFVGVAAVCDLLFTESNQKHPKQSLLDRGLPVRESPDILRELAEKARKEGSHTKMVGFAAETIGNPSTKTAQSERESTERLYDAARDKLKRKGLDAILANDITQKGVMGGETTALHLLTKKDLVECYSGDKLEVGCDLALALCALFGLGKERPNST